MSRENLQLVRQIYAAADRDDWESVRSRFDPDIEWREPPDSPGAGVYRGFEGVQDSYSRWVSAWADYRLELDELVDAGDRIVARCRQVVTGKISGVPISQPFFAVWTLEQNRVTRMEMFQRETEALEAAGLSE